MLIRCNKDDDKHLVYIAIQKDDFPPLDEPTAEMFGEDNIVVFDDISKEIFSGMKYKWRVDCLEVLKNERRKGDIWNFTMH